MKRVLAILLDAAEPALIEKWTDDGSLPVMQRLRKEGAYGHLASTAALLSGSCSVSFYTGQNPANHGFYNYLAWNPEHVAAELPDDTQMQLVPFWDAFPENGPRSIIVDIPHSFAPGPSYHGLEVIGWSSHDSIVPFTAFPPELGKQILAKYGGPFVSEEKYGAMTARDFQSIKDEAFLVTSKVRDLSLDLMKSEAWDLSLVCFPSIHRGGHRLLNMKNIKGSLPASEQPQFSEALHNVYIACDQAIGQFLETADPDTTVLVFSLHGMGDNYCLTWILPEMLQSVLGEEPKTSTSVPGLLSGIRNLIPASWRHYVKSHLPMHLRHNLTGFWRTNQINWAKTRAFSMMADVQGLIRVNLKGRESLGIVEPGKEYDELCEKIIAGLQTYVDADSGQPVIEKIVRTDSVFEGKNMDKLPDLIVTWVHRPASELRAITSPVYGTINWPTPGGHPEGRSGTHLADGMLIAWGKDIKSGTIKDAHILDLAPTILTLLGQPVPAEMEGKPLRL